MEPPPSLPCAAGASPAATAAAAPPLDPPADRDRSQGVRAGGGVAGQAELGGGGLTGDHRTRRAQLGGHEVVLGGDIVVVRQRAQRLPHPGDHVEILDRDRHAGQWRQLSGVARLRDCLLGGQCLLAGEGRGDREECPDIGVQPLDSVQVVIGDVGRRQLALADGGGQLQHGQVVNLGHATDRTPPAIPARPDGAGAPRARGPRR